MPPEQPFETVLVHALDEEGCGALVIKRQADVGLDVAAQNREVVLVAEAGGAVELMGGPESCLGGLLRDHAEGERVDDGVGGVANKPPRRVASELGEPAHQGGNVGDAEANALKLRERGSELLTR